MHDGHRHWIDLLNRQRAWVTDESLLQVIPEEEREFRSLPDWPRSKALAFLSNNVEALRLNHDRLESGLEPDVDLINPVLEEVSLRLVDRRRRRAPPRPGADGMLPPVLVCAAPRDRLNRGTAALKMLVGRAVFHFARYADWRLRDPAWPSATPGIFRVLPCAACGDLTPRPDGRPALCPPCGRAAQDQES